MPDRVSGNIVLPCSSMAGVACCQHSPGLYTYLGAREIRMTGVSMSNIELEYMPQSHATLGFRTAPIGTQLGPF